MPKIVKVTPTQVHAAKLKLKRSVSAGRDVSPSVTAIANARKAGTQDLDRVHQRAG